MTTNVNHNTDKEYLKYLSGKVGILIDSNEDAIMNAIAPRMRYNRKLIEDFLIGTWRQFLIETQIDKAIAHGKQFQKHRASGQNDLFGML